MTLLIPAVPCLQCLYTPDNLIVKKSGSPWMFVRGVTDPRERVLLAHDTVQNVAGSQRGSRPGEPIRRK